MFIRLRVHAALILIIMTTINKHHKPRLTWREYYSSLSYAVVVTLIVTQICHQHTHPVSLGGKHKHINKARRLAIHPNHDIAGVRRRNV